MRRELTELYEKRVRAFLDRVARGLPIADHAPLEAAFHLSDDPVAWDQRPEDPSAYRGIVEGETWGSAWQSAWFRLRGRVPEAWAGRDVSVQLSLDGEICIFDDTGCPSYGLTDRSVFADDYRKDLYPLFRPCRGGEKVDLWAEAAANGLFGIVRDPNAERFAADRHGSYAPRATHLKLVLFDTELWHFGHDVETLASLYEALPEHAPRRTRILLGVCKALDVFADDRRNAPSAREALRPLLEVAPNPADLEATAVGHAHIDTAWLWPMRESIRKCARTFSSQVALLERYPDYVFGASQPQLYLFVKDHYPALYEKIKHYVAEGRWECQGGMWVEADCNVPDGESLVRQFLHGKNFYRDEFGVEVKHLWLPDVFGYSPALPQIMRRAGCDVFLTQKLSWSLHNKFPHSTFRWRGIDGSEVVSHFPPEDTYNSGMHAGNMVRAQHRFKESDRLDGFISLFGIGDGGGGPKEDHLERLHRMRSLNGCPRVIPGSAEGFFDQLRAAEDLETWDGELYLELHRGTLTTQAATKRGNRRMEKLLRDVELVCSCLPADRYPREAVDRAWKKLLTNQFHDILPGSSIHRVYEDTLREYEEIEATCRVLLAEATPQVLAADAEAVTLLNTLSHPFTAPVRLPVSWKGHEVLDPEGAPVVVQNEEDTPVGLPELPALSFTTLRKGKARGNDTIRPDERVLENDQVRYVFAEDATLVRAIDKETGRDLLAEGESGNLFSLYVDRPHNWDAWDIDLHYEDGLIEHAAPVSCTVLPGGPVRRGLRFELAIGDSRIVQSVFLAASSRRLDFETRVDWKEYHRMLRVAFPTRVRASEATFDIQYGYIRRPTHRNTSWDMARFEVCAHRYVDLSDADGGIALLNDCKYGHKVRDHVIDLNLLRSPSDPDPDADYGEHTFTYSLLPHPDGFLASDVMDQAAMLNRPPVVFEGYAAGGLRLPCTVEGDGLSLEVLKQSEQEEDLIVRVVERRGRRSSGTVRLDDAAGRLVETDLMEWKDGASHAAPLQVELEPFEIRTYRIRTADEKNHGRKRRPFRP